MKLSLRIIIAGLLMVLSHVVMAETLDRDTVIKRLIKSYGGEVNLRKADTMIQEWGMIAVMSKRHGTDVRSVRIPGQLRVELTYPDKTEIRMLNGQDGHVAFNERLVQTATPPQRDAMLLQLMRLYSPLVLRDRSDSVSLQIDGEFCALYLLENGVRADYLVNRETWRIEKVVGTLSVMGTEMQFLTEYSDFKFVDGILVHHKENKFAGGTNTAVLQLHRVTFGARLDENSFVP